MIHLHSAWAAIRFMARHQMQGGKDVCIPCIIPSPTFSPVPPSIQSEIMAERTASEAVTVLGIAKALHDAATFRLITKNELQAILEGARLQVKLDTATQAYNAACLNNASPKKPTFKKSDNDRINKAANLSRKLDNLFASRGITNNHGDKEGHQ